jgi:DNA-binding response OmpR family regulator
VTDPELPQPLQILFADDNRFLGDAVALHLNAAGYHVEVVADGFEAWNSISENLGRFQVLVTDHRMPGISGLELVHLLKEANFTGWIISYSGALTLEERENYRSLGVAVVEKTTRTEDLLATIKRLTTGTTARRAKNSRP